MVSIPRYNIGFWAAAWLHGCLLFYFGRMTSAFRFEGRLAAGTFCVVYTLERI